jgi:ADP-ribosyl-[dinitrogen reductase] hydrolase
MPVVPRSGPHLLGERATIVFGGRPDPGTATPVLPPPGTREDRAVGALLGLAIGDAIGTTLEFAPRDSQPPITDMVGGGPFHLRPGEWTDDTSMALALADSLITCGWLDTRDLMTRFVAWWREGTYSVTGTCFDIGTATARALARFERTGDPHAGDQRPSTAGNGSLMRIAPLSIWGAGAQSLVLKLAYQQSRTTHAAPACLAACMAFSELLRAEIDQGGMVFVPEGCSHDPEVDAVLRGRWRGRARSEIRSSGYVVHSLEAALWCVAETSNYRDAVLLAANLGEDADTTAAITGQLAGARYGAQAIPRAWRDRVAWGPRIVQVALDVLATGDRYAGRG